MHYYTPPFKDPQCPLPRWRGSRLGSQAQGLACFREPCPLPISIPNPCTFSALSSSNLAQTPSILGWQNHIIYSNHLERLQCATTGHGQTELQALESGNSPSAGRSQPRNWIGMPCALFLLPSFEFVLTYMLCLHTQIFTCLHTHTRSHSSMHTHSHTDSLILHTCVHISVLTLRCMPTLTITHTHTPATSQQQKVYRESCF